MVVTRACKSVCPAETIPMVLAARDPAERGIFFVFIARARKRGTESGKGSAENELNAMNQIIYVQLGLKLERQSWLHTNHTDR